MSSGLANEVLLSFAALGITGYLTEIVHIQLMSQECLTKTYRLAVGL